jgi:DNA-binding transcriptional LysR family regulator
MRHARTPTFAELQAFVRAAQSGATTRAGESLGLTQSAVSRALAGLEDRLGVRLFHRVRQRLVLSDAGRAFLPEAARLLEDLDRATLNVMAFGGQVQVLRLACLPTFAAAWLIPRLASLPADITIDLSATLSLPDFATDPRDAAILRGPAPRGLHSQVLAQENLVAVCAPARAGQDLAAMPLIQQTTRPDLWLGWFRDAGDDPRDLLRGPRFEQFSMVLAAARAGLGAALVPAVLAQDDLAAGRLVRAAPGMREGGDPYRLIWPDRSADLPALAALRAALPPLVAGGTAPH